MTKFRKKPVVIDAVQWNGDNFDDIRKLEDKSARCVRRIANDDTLVIATLEGDHTARIGDYIIKGVVGELYPVLAVNICLEDVVGP